MKNSIIVLCVGMLGAVAPGESQAGHQAIPAARANYGTLPVGYYRPTSRTPIAQVPANSPTGTSNCVGGRCVTQQCPNGYCPQHGVSHSGRTLRTRQQQTRYHTLPASRSSQPRGNSYPVPRTYDVKRTNTNRPVSPTSFGTQRSPFFN